MMSRIWAVIGVVAGAGLLANAPSSWGQDSAAAGKTAEVATPRTPDGHPSLSGYWSVASSGGLFGAGGALSGTKPILSKTGEDISTVVPYRHGKFSNLENDFY